MEFMRIYFTKFTLEILSSIPICDSFEQCQEDSKTNQNVVRLR